MNRSIQYFTCFNIIIRWTQDISCQSVSCSICGTCPVQFCVYYLQYYVYYLQYLETNAVSRSLYGASDLWVFSLRILWIAGERRRRLWLNPTKLEENQYRAIDWGGRDRQGLEIQSCFMFWFRVVLLFWWFDCLKTSSMNTWSHKNKLYQYI